MWTWEKGAILYVTTSDPAHVRPFWASILAPIGSVTVRIVCHLGRTGVYLFHNPHSSTRFRQVPPF